MVFVSEGMFGASSEHRLFRQGLETGHVSHTFYGRRLCAVNIIYDKKNVGVLHLLCASVAIFNTPF